MYWIVVGMICLYCTIHLSCSGSFVRRLLSTHAKRVGTGQLYALRTPISPKERIRRSINQKSLQGSKITRTLLRLRDILYKHINLKLRDELYLQPMISSYHIQTAETASHL